MVNYGVKIFFTTNSSSFENYACMWFYKRLEKTVLEPNIQLFIARWLRAQAKKKQISLGLNFKPQLISLCGKHSWSPPQQPYSPAILFV